MILLFVLTVEQGMKRNEMSTTTVFSIQITLKKGILDNAGNAVIRALNSIGFDTASNVRIGKILFVELDHADEDLIHSIAKSQTNEVMEDYSVSR